ncbi:MAG: NAD(P)-dependent glycerol-3-phosphate dehydrogenase [Candidatus Omnitrophica bacterium]|nr:NAD(P)-dependent glycerol-3-phosphate dehydrogenase [Candidatus Omnitrophota bacterium]
MNTIAKGAKITLIGDGGWGTTLAILLKQQGYRVSLWGPFADYLRILDKKRQNPKFLPGVKIPKEISFSEHLQEAIQDAALIILAIPSHFLRGVLKRIKKESLGGTLILSAVKGIENDTLMRVSELIQDVWGRQSVAVLSGPTISYEVARGIPTTCVVASEDIALAEQIQDIFICERFRVYTSCDLVGVELGGALKNVIALACGISDGLGFGANTKAAILTRGLVEITRLGLKMGARQETFYGLSGLGDLVTTCISTHGRNRWVGEQIGKGKKLPDILSKMEMVAEGLRTAKSAFMLAQKYNVEMPITRQIYAVLYEDKDPRQAVRDLMLREKKAE